MKKINLNVSKLIIVTLIIVIIAMSSIIITSKKFKTEAAPNTVTQVVNDSTGFFDRLVSAPGRFISNKKTELGNFLNTYQENKDLKKKLYSLQDDQTDLEKLRSENKSLRESQGLNETLSYYQKITSTVISRSPASWDDMIIVNSGSDDGVRDNMIVVANGGVIGRVSQTNKKTSKITLLTGKQEDSNKIPVRIGSADKPSYGLITGYDSEKKAYVLSQVKSDTKWSKGDTVVTSGLGEDTPQGLSVGKVIDSKSKSQGMEEEIYVEPSGSFLDIQFVTIIQKEVGTVADE